ncbi:MULTISPECIES: ABC transporter permease subunit [Mesorhizobium]|uniref:ABC transporter permease subunit n=4 Tax=Mesorhizobium TaxID=68287 RepID=A0ABZ0VIY7_9HYPH|nr:MULTISPECIES: ABC transporter permease subunit [Mesorhizobium]MBZ9910419.1 ABC transporter permease subunit [Mesorhizobium sp. BR115XR7A]QGX80641.1 ABC transporter permease subunit [Mesorhizobium japonicum R7A]QJF04785.1 ABC transporter permease subunit [Mesorhizobium japonicum R7A]QJF10854.1 ABC transporter permease subunit [Mesorhizobium japonicum]QJI86727.1 ABC transporter permease subunit [Mesorhizobium japonicum]
MATPYHVVRSAIAWPVNNREASLLLAPAALLLGVFFFIPLSGLLSLSLLDPGPTFAHYHEFLDNPTNWIILARTFALATKVTLICLLLGYPLAYWIVSARTWVAAALLLAVVLPFFTSYLVRTYAWMVLLGRFGVINQLLMATGLTERPVDLIYNQFSVLVAMVYILMPYTVLVLISVMKGIPYSLTRAAASLGASAAQNFWRVFFPLSAPGVIAAGLLVFVFALGFYITPVLLDGPNTMILPMQIDSYVNGTLNWPLAATAATVLLAITLVLYSISNRFVDSERLLSSNQSTAHSAGHTARHSTSAYIQLIDFVAALVRGVGHGIRFPAGIGRGWERLAPGRKLLRGLSLLLVAFLVSPILIIVPISFSSSRFLDFPPPGLSLQWYQAYFTSAAWVSATWESLGVGIAVACLSLAIGSAAAMALVRGSPRMRRIGYQLLLAPMIVPSIVNAVALYFLFARLHLINTSFALVTAHSIGAVPLVVLIVAASLQSQNIILEYAAASLGASRVVTIWRIVLPLIRPALIVSGFFAFLSSFDEVVLSLYLSGPDTTTLPIKMWSGIREEITPTIAAVSSLLIAFTIFIYVSVAIFRQAGERQAQQVR